ncbi:MAG: alpha-ketoacid dehydrogenase subunit beta, partial [Spirochaetota bacterium]
LRTEMRLDDRVVVLGEDVGRAGGVFRATAGLQELFGEDRCFDTPVSEAGIVGAAVGMAAAGLRPVVEIQFAGFVYPAFNQIAGHLSRMRNRTRGAVTAPLVVRMPYGAGTGAPEHHAESPEALFGHLSGLKVVIPSTPHDAKGLLISAIRDPDPVLFMEPKRIYRSVRQQVPHGGYEVRIGRARVVAPGEQATLVSYGAQMKEAREAAALLRDEGISVELIDLRTVYPFDVETVVESVRKTGWLVVAHESPRSFGVGAELVASVLEGVSAQLRAPPVRLCGADTVVPLARGERHYLIDAGRIAGEVRSALARAW